MDLPNVQVFDLNSILYGALGSALFAFIVYVVPKIISALGELISKYSVEQRERRLNTLWLKYYGMTHEDDDQSLESTSCQVALIYKSLRQALKAFIWISLGLIFQSVVDLLGIIGFIGGLYYLFSALGQVQTVGEDVDPQVELEKIEAELNKIELNKSVQPTANSAAAD